MKSSSERFVEKVDSSGHGCWEWRAGRDKDGYGKFAFPRGGGKWRHVQAHRAAWELVNGAIPDGMCVLHKCDNPPCVRVEHLFLGTVYENNTDRANKGRNADHRGELSGTAKITELDVLDIRARHASGETKASITRDLGLSYMEVSRVISRERWAHVA